VWGCYEKEISERYISEVARHAMDRIKVKDISYPNIEEKIGTVGRFLC
jgi:hypothetical protein